MTKMVLYSEIGKNVFPLIRLAITMNTLYRPQVRVIAVLGELSREKNEKFITLRIITVVSIA